MDTSHAAGVRLTSSTVRPLPPSPSLPSSADASALSASPNGSRHHNTTSPQGQQQPQQQLAATAPSLEQQIVVDLKGELLHATRQLTLLRQQASTEEETCTELRERCQNLEGENRTLSLELQDARDRLQARQVRVDEHRRDAADSKLRVLSLTAERDALTEKVQEAWDRVAELGAALRTREAETTRLQAEVREVWHAQDLSSQQRATVDSELRLLHAAAKESSDDRRAGADACKRLTSAMHAALRRLAAVLSDAACDYQQSLHEDGAWGPSLLTAAPTTRERAGSGSNSIRSSGTPHVVLSPAHRETDTPRRVAAESTRLQAEHLLYNAEAVMWKENSPAHAEALVEQQHNQSTPPPFSLLPSAEVALSAQPAVHAALAPLLLAMKQVAAMLGTVRHEHRRLVAEAAHFHARYEEVQRELEIAQGSLRERETEDSASRGQVRQLQQHTEIAEASLRQWQLEDTHRCAALASILQCREDWALIQHSVERLLVRHAELQKDLMQQKRRVEEEERVGLVSRTAARMEDTQPLHPAPAAAPTTTERAATSAVPSLSATRLDTPPQPQLHILAVHDSPDAYHHYGDDTCSPTRSPVRQRAEGFTASPPLQRGGIRATPPSTSHALQRSSYHKALDLNHAVGRAYPAPLPAAPTTAVPHTALQTERMLLHSLYGAVPRTSSSPPPPLPVAPSNTAPSRASSSGYQREGGSTASGFDQSSMFAVEVLQVIEALDRRVSGALKRAPRS